MGKKASGKLDLTEEDINWETIIIRKRVEKKLTSIIPQNEATDSKDYISP